MPNQKEDQKSVETIHTEFLTGVAGSGKTFEIKRRIAERPEYGVLASTTGVSAMNLDTVTVNSILKYYDTESLREAFKTGRLERTLLNLTLGEGRVENLVIDEVSMLDGDALDVLYQAIVKLKKNYDATLGLVLTGDFAQLPPVKAKFAFEADCWPVFENTTTRLQKVWRQSDEKFLEALNWVRKGNGYKAIKIIKDLGIETSATNDDHFEGLTIKATNREADSMNNKRFAEISGSEILMRSARNGDQRSEWKNIPETLSIKVGSLVMILANHNVEGVFEYVNGDLGIVEDYDEIRQRFAVRLKRNDTTVWVSRIVRENKIRTGDANWRNGNARWQVVGTIDYMPLRLAYAATCHKTQGLTLDRIQVDIRGFFFGNPGMVYVALSRCRTPEGLRIVGSRELLARRTIVDQKITRFL